MADLPRVKVFFTGVGGQGSLTASRLLGEACMAAGIHVLVGEIHGMSQRGGVVESSVLIGDLYGPILEDGEADLVVAFEPVEAARALRKANADSVVIANTRVVLPSTVSRGDARYPDVDALLATMRPAVQKLVAFDATDLALEAGSVLAVNMVLLGAACATGTLPVDPDQVRAAIENKTPERFRSVNLEAFDSGLAAAKELMTA